jgi:Protein kinase domain
MAGETPAEAGWMLTGLAAGSVVAGYRVESRIGAGGMAMVFRARDEALGRTVALKVLAPALADDAPFRERFIRESRAAAVVDHPHIIPVYGAGEFDGVLYIAMRYVAGGDLRALLQPVPAFPISTPPATPVPAPSPREAAVPGSPAPAHAPTQFGSSLGFADTAGRTIAQPGSRPPTPGTSRPAAVRPGRRRGPRRGVLAAAVVVVAAGGVTAAVLALSSPGSPPASAALHSPLLLATLAEPEGAAPTGVAFTSDGTLVTLDAAGAYSWDIATGRPARTDYASAKVLTSTAVSIKDGMSLRAGSEEDVVHVLNAANGAVQVLKATTSEIVATLTAPSGTAANAFTLSPDGTEAALADSNGKTYVWKIAS